MASSDSFQVAAWSLRPSVPVAAENSFAFTPSANSNNEESAFPATDNRKPVAQADIVPGGKYYSIVKLQIKYDNQDVNDTRYAQGTGWLVKPNLLVTAGHCAFDHVYQFGRAVEVKAFLGYNGKNSVGLPNVQFRHGARIVTPANWIASEINRANDVSFIELDSPFNDVQPFVSPETPVNGEQVLLGVAGYPADRTLQGEPAAQMYEMFAATSWDLRNSASNMLEYKIMTYAGQSGSPVIVSAQGPSSILRAPLVSYGAHVYIAADSGSASVFKGQFGNNFMSYISAFDQQFPAPGARIALLTVGSEEFSFSEASDASVSKKSAHINLATDPSIPEGSTPAFGLAGPAVGPQFGAGLLLQPGAEGSIAETPVSSRPLSDRPILGEAALQGLMQSGGGSAGDLIPAMKKDSETNK